MALRILFLTAEPCPTYRADVNTLFGRYLPRHGIYSDIVARRTPGITGPFSWAGGETFVCNVQGGMAKKHVTTLFHGIKQMILADRHHYSAIQVRDMPVLAAFGLLLAHLKRLPFFYWMSFPMPEGQIRLARERGLSAGLIKFLFPWTRGRLGRFLLYQFVLPRADFIFVQTDRMKEIVAAKGIDPVKMFPVPMGADMETMRRDHVVPADDPRLKGRRVILYLGSLDRPRQIDILLEMIALVRTRIPEALLVLVGDTEDEVHRSWLMQKAKDLGVSDAILWTGWLPIEEGWRYVRAAEVGLSPIPRGELLDVGSPTKALEYMALGLPVVGNDNPDQATVINESGAGLCVELDASTFSNAVVQLLTDESLRHTMSSRGPDYIARKRSYQIISNDLQARYKQLFGQTSEISSQPVGESRSKC